MIDLTDDCLSFTFPEIARQLRAHVERQIGHPNWCAAPHRKNVILSLSKDLILPRAEEVRSEHRCEPAPRRRCPRRSEVLRQAQDDRVFRKVRRTRRLSAHRLRVLTLTADEIEAALRTAALRAAGLDAASFPALTIAFQRTLRIPDDGRTYPLPAGLGAFPLRSVDGFPATAPASCLQRGGAVLPMDQSEALWISFSARYPCAVKIAAGKINAVSGAAWTAELHSEPQDDVVVPGQPWLDGFSVGAGLIRPFVAMPLGAGDSVEEQLTGRADVGGMQLQSVSVLRGSPSCQQSGRNDLAGRVRTVTFPP
jgi:hypothetical protein